MDAIHQLLKSFNDGVENGQRERPAKEVADLNVTQPLKAIWALVADKFADGFSVSAHRGGNRFVIHPKGDDRNTVKIMIDDNQEGGFTIAHGDGGSQTNASSENVLRGLGYFYGQHGPR